MPRKRKRKGNRKKTITVCASASFYKHVLEVEDQLRQLGFNVKIPHVARIMKKTNNFNVGSYKTWFENKKDYKVKTKLMKLHFKKVIESDAILVLNHERSGMLGYIGGNVLMEMVIAFHHKKPIFIYNEISENLSVKEEVYGLNPFFINGDLALLHKKLR